MAEEVFNTDFSDMTEFDSTIDINQVFENSVNPIEEPTPPEVIPEEDDDKKPKEVDENIKDVNKVFDEMEKSTPEEIVEPDETEIKDPAHTDTKDSPSSETPFTVVFAKDLYEQGLLSSYDEEEYKTAIETDGEAVALRNLIKTEVDQNITAAKSDLDTGYQEYLTLIGKGVQKESAGTLIDLKKTYNNINIEALEAEEGEDMRRGIITEYYKMTTKLSDARISKLVDKSFDLGDDLEESKEYLGSINSMIDEQITYEETQAVESRRLNEEENTRQLTVLKENIDSLSEIIPGQRINKQTKDKMYNDITKPTKDANGNVTNALWSKRAEDPVFFDMRLAYLLENDFFVKGKAWNKINAVKTTKEASRLEDFLSSQKNTGSKTGGFPTDHRQPLNEDVRDIIKSTGSILNR